MTESSSQAHDDGHIGRVGGQQASKARRKGGGWCGEKEEDTKRIRLWADREEGRRKAEGRKGSGGNVQRRVGVDGGGDIEPSRWLRDVRKAAAGTGRARPMTYTCLPQVAQDSKVCRAGNSNGSKWAYSSQFSYEIQKSGKDIIENAPRSSKNNE